MLLALFFLCSSGALVAGYIALSYWQAKRHPTPTGEDGMEREAWRCRLHQWEQTEECVFVCRRCGYQAGSDLISQSSRTT